jgi:hypothetical protein
MFTLGDELTGKKARCQRCRQTFTVCDGTAPSDDESSTTEPKAVPAGSNLEAPELLERKRKKKRKLQRQDSSFRVLIGVLVSAGLLLLVGGGALLIWALSGPSKPKVPDLVGKWKGVPQLNEAVGDATKDSNLPPVARDFAQALAQKVADQLMTVTVEFKQSGRAYFGGKTDAIGVPSATDGPWEIVRTDEDIVFVKMGTADAPFEARLAFQNKNTFTLTRADKKDQAPVVFIREKD